MTFGDDPGPGQGFWFLTREVVDSIPGTYDEPSGSQLGSRDAEIAAAAAACQ